MAATEFTALAESLTRKGMVPVTTTTYSHQLSGRTFIAEEGEGTFGAASVDGHWDTGQAGTIWPAEVAFGALVWVAA